MPILSDLEYGAHFTVADTTFIRFREYNGIVDAVARNFAFISRFGDNNNLKESDVLRRLNDEYLPRIIQAAGEENLHLIHTDLTTLDGLDPWGDMTSKVSLPTLDFYRSHVAVFDRYPVTRWWWLATPESAQPHSAPDYITCVTPSGDVGCYFYSSDRGVRPFFRFSSSLFVS